MDRRTFVSAVALPLVACVPTLAAAAKPATFYVLFSNKDYPSNHLRHAMNAAKERAPGVSLSHLQWFYFPATPDPRDALTPRGIIGWRHDPLTTLSLEDREDTYRQVMHDIARDNRYMLFLQDAPPLRFVDRRPDLPEHLHAECLAQQQVLRELARTYRREIVFVPLAA